MPLYRLQFIQFTTTEPMTITEAIAALAPVGVTAIECRQLPNLIAPAAMWYVTQNGNIYSYCTDLDRLVRALEVANDWGVD